MPITVYINQYVVYFQSIYMFNPINRQHQPSWPHDRHKSDRTKESPPRQCCFSFISSYTTNYTHTIRIIACQRQNIYTHTQPNTRPSNRSTNFSVIIFIFSRPLAYVERRINDTSTREFRDAVLSTCAGLTNYICILYTYMMTSV